MRTRLTPTALLAIPVSTALPGRGTGDENHQHTAPPGRAPAGGGDQSGPMRGCKDDPRG